MFHIVDDCYVILRSRGVYKQAKVYTYEGKLFAGYGSGFIRLGQWFGETGGTSMPNVSWLPGVDVRPDKRGFAVLTRG